MPSWTLNRQSPWALVLVGTPLGLHSTMQVFNLQILLYSRDDAPHPTRS